MFLKDGTIVLMMVDVYSRYLQMHVLNSKRADVVKRKMEEFIKLLVGSAERRAKRRTEGSQEGFQPVYTVIITDAGTEFAQIKKIEGVRHVISKSFYGSGFIESHIGRTKKVLLKLALLDPNIDYQELIPITQEILNDRYMTVTGCSADDVLNKTCLPRKHQCVRDKFVHPIHSFCLIPNQQKKQSKGKIGEKLSVMTNYDTRVYLITKKTFYNCRYRYSVAPFGYDEDDHGQDLLNKFYYEELYIIEPNQLNKYIKEFADHHEKINVDIEEDSYE